MRTCAWLPPHILFFHFHTFFRREISVVLSVFCCLAAFCGLFWCGLCCVLFGVFFGFLCAVFWFRVCMVVCLVIPVCFAGFSDVGENKEVSVWICTKRGRFGCDAWGIWGDTVSRRLICFWFVTVPRIHLEKNTDNTDAPSAQQRVALALRRAAAAAATERCLVIQRYS